MNATNKPSKEQAFWDVIIIGAGISGINAAYRLQTQLPSYSYTILEARPRMGGTWDLFRYPGIRSDSDLITFGFAWNPWDKENPIADGTSIKQYMQKSASQYGIDKQIQYETSVASASWSSEDALWTLSVSVNGGQATFLTTRFLIFGAGYYDYHTPLAAAIPGLENFKGHTIHPQFWPENLDYADKKVVVIGSGATAITLVPELAQKAASTTMLQRSPTYIVSLPNKVRMRPWWSRFMPRFLFSKLQRLFWIIRGRFIYNWCMKNPEKAKALFAKGAVSQLPQSIPYDPHFKPSYSPWEQRLCICPDGDFYTALREGRANVETDTIESVVEDGIVLASGKKLDCDMIVTATGLKLQFAGGVKIEVDGKPVEIHSKYWWNGVMIQDIPNAAFVMGYPNASWTLGADATALFVCRFLKALDSKKQKAAAPYLEDAGSLKPTPSLPLTSTYVRLGSGSLPKASQDTPWVARRSYFEDVFFAKYGSLTKGMKFIDTSRTEKKYV
ncbi:hypothetical protein LTS17_000116 [Exophiala oligosperma]